MTLLQSELAGIRSPNPFWLASAPPTDKAYNVIRAFKAGWGGVVWKTLIDVPVVNVCSRYGAFNVGNQKMLGFNNIELISDRPLDVNLAEIASVKQQFPDRAIVVSLMLPYDEKAWQTILPRVKATGADGIELNFGCPHGMSERGMGSAIGQVPEYVEQVTRWCKHSTDLPVLVKLTPNITDIRHPARAAKQGGADAISLINTINSIVSVNLDTFAPEPTVDGKGTHGGYCGPAVKPIALNMLAEIARDPITQNVPISGIGGISDWRDAVEFMLLGANNVQICTAAMHYGFRIIEELMDGLTHWMQQKGFTRLSDFHRKAVHHVTDWQYLNMNYKTIAQIDQDKCIQCGLCYIACEDTSHQAISAQLQQGKRHYEVIDAECVGCNLCQHVCPVPDCITMNAVNTGLPYVNWTHDPRNPHRS